jgi:hypothetical protein
MSGLISSFVDIFIHPIIVMILGDLQSWMIPLGGMVYHSAILHCSRPEKPSITD